MRSLFFRTRNGERPFSFLFLPEATRHKVGRPRIQTLPPFSLVFRRRGPRFPIIQGFRPDQLDLGAAILPSSLLASEGSIVVMTVFSSPGTNTSLSLLFFLRARRVVWRYFSFTWHARCGMSFPLLFCPCNGPRWCALSGTPLRASPPFRFLSENAGACGKFVGDIGPILGQVQSSPRTSFP